MREVRSLGILSSLASQQEYARHKGEMAGQAGALRGEDRARVAAYLRRGHVVLAIMEYTTDILQGRFGTSGGSGILTDGTYYWRGDAADYVETYGVSPGDAFVRHVDGRNGEPPSLTQDDIMDVDDYFMYLRRERPA
ncbi:MULTISPECIES: hypothetical protein [unclassified Streptomyces]|uniref:hypothetical protein n=1 Tax=unclassified Streptomyces TaxID=2593676 RepID=UPI002ED6197B|nr:hypothetical protein OH827_15025 [Streptomyces sp. NBC_00891]WSY06245.1 hypothetical protein OG464_15025 [Streptomyces sp. NBC_00890]WSZ07870.1 hypothetical protein OG704_15025 [Streptomyces sp. NBC_00869]WSZ24631.1 hypothetical protein OG498_18540 [Streptomyces sp. NBC_00870]